MWARVDQWLQFSDKWDECLNEEPKLAYFKMHEADKRIKQFDGWSKATRNAKVEKLAEIIDEYAFRAVNITYSVEGLQAFLLPRPEGAGSWPLDKPYFWAFHQYIKAACFELFDIGVGEPCEIVFDEQVQMAAKVKAWYRAMLFAIPQPIRALAPMEPLFRDDKEFRPLQAADMLAWLQRRNAASIPHDFAWLQEKFKTLRYSRYSIMPGFVVAPEMTAILELTPEERIEFVKEMWKLETFHYGRNGG